MLNRREFLSCLPVPLLAQNPSATIRRVDIYHHSHTDVGFTDSPGVTRDMQVRFLDSALDACRNRKSFRWTAEAMVTVDDWWRASPPARRRQLIETLRSGQMDIMALPFNQAPFMNAAQWRQALEWVPASVWSQLKPRAGMQNDVNGFPRAGALRLLDKGVNHLLMGINADSGGPPFHRPAAFWWKMPDGRKLFVWMGEHYGTAYSYFEPKWWGKSGRGGQVSVGPPRPGDFHKTDEASLRAAHAHCLKRLAELQAGGYGYETLILSYTNQWRYDNDPPFPALAEFIDAWNKLGLKPELRFTTATDAVFAMEKEVGARVPVLEGEWTDWWANGDASGPREVAASRVAKRYLAAAASPVWGPMPATGARDVEETLKDLCLFDEHTWGANISISHPDNLMTLGQYTEKSILAYRPMAKAEWLLGRRAHTALDGRPEGLYVVNTAKEPYSGWVQFVPSALAEGDVAVEDPQTGATAEISKEKGAAVFWAEGLKPEAVTLLRTSKTKSEGDAQGAPVVQRDEKGWPVSATWPGMTKPLFAQEAGRFLSVGVAPPADRGTVAKMHQTADNARREEMRKEAFRTIDATFGDTRAEENRHTLIFEQPFEHPRLRAATRRMELWRRQPRARVTVRFERTSSVAPEVFYIAFALPVEDGTMPSFSNGGVPFVPYSDQLPGSCRDYYAIDGWARYATPAGDWLWVTRDAPLVTVGGPHTVERRTTPPADTHRLLAMVFDNFWHTNFVANSHGEMEFQFDLLWREKIASPDSTAEALLSEPVVLVNPTTRQAPELSKDLLQP